MKNPGQASGRDSMWLRFMSRLLAETKITQRFTQYDLRGKVGLRAEFARKRQSLPRFFPNPALRHAPLR